jgi:hypothetical protein
MRAAETMLDGINCVSILVLAECNGCGSIKEINITDSENLTLSVSLVKFITKGDTAVLAQKPNNFIILAGSESTKSANL